MVISKMSKETKIILTVLAVVVVLAAAVVVYFIVQPGSEESTAANERLDLGELHLLERSYGQALVQFLGVIEAEPNNPRGYTGAADAYAGLGSLSEAEAVLRQGLEALPGNLVIEAKLREVETTLSGGEMPAETQTLTETPTTTPSESPTPTPAPTPTPTPETRISDSGHEIIEFGGYDWRILEVQGGNALIISDMILENRTFGARGGSTWENSIIRYYLNGEFYRSFSEADRERIVQVTNNTQDNLWYSWSGTNPDGNDTEDYIFLLSLEEVDRYFGNSGDYENIRRKAKHPDGWFPHDTGEYISNEYDEHRVAYLVGGRGKAVRWWLRSPGLISVYDVKYQIAFVNDNGSVYTPGTVYTSSGGVRPALWLKLES